MFLLFARDKICCLHNGILKLSCVYSSLSPFKDFVRAFHAAPTTISLLIKLIDCRSFHVYAYRRFLSPTFITDFLSPIFQIGCFIVYAAQFLRSAHDADFVAVFVNVRAVFAVIWPLVFQPAEALHINHIAGLQVSDRLRRGGYGSRFRNVLRFSRWLCVGSCRRFRRYKLRLIGGFTGRLRLWSRSLFFLWWQIDFCF